jgi:hypothetical protein
VTLSVAKSHVNIPLFIQTNALTLQAAPMLGIFIHIMPGNQLEFSPKLLVINVDFDWLVI